VLDDLGQDLVNDKVKSYLVIDDTQMYVKQEPDSAEKTEEMKTSFLLWPCTDLAQPCLANTMLTAIDADEN